MDSRSENLLNAVVNKSGVEELSPPLSRIEKILFKLNDSVSGSNSEIGDLDQPMSRIEELLLKLNDSISTSGGVTSWNDLQDRPFGDETVDSEIIPETEFAFEDADGMYVCQITNDLSGIQAGDTVKVILDGTVYLCVAKEAHGMVLIGNPSITGMDFEDHNGEPFYISPASQMIVTNLAGSTHRVGVFGVSTTVVPLDEKYIPSSIQRVGYDVILNSSTEGSEKKFRITVDDTGTLTATAVITP